MRLNQTAAVLAALSLTIPAPASAQLGGLGRSLSSIFGCDAAGSKQTTGAVIGGVVGGVVGNRVADDNRTIGTAIGAALGAAAGAYLGCRMQKSDQAKAEAATREALNRNSAQTWTNPETGASGDVQVISTTGGATTPGGMRLAKGVDLASGYDTISGRYVARGAANLRAGPSTSTAVVGKLAKGAAVDVLARVSGTNWLLAGRNGVGIGYVSEPLLSAQAPGLQIAATQVSAPQGGPLCRTFDQTVRTANGAAETQRYTACKSPSGEWVVQA